jgi:hypothetical protein
MKQLNLHSSPSWPGLYDFYQSRDCCLYGQPALHPFAGPWRRGWNQKYAWAIRKALGGCV